MRLRSEKEKENKETIWTKNKNKMRRRNDKKKEGDEQGWRRGLGEG